jgi:hypothetical protein
MKTGPGTDLFFISPHEVHIRYAVIDVKSAPHAKHTTSLISWLNTRGPGVRIWKRASQFSLKLTKDENN